MVRFVGCANPRGREAPYDGFELTHSDLALACKEIVGKPLLIEHEGQPVGAVESAWLAADGRMLVQAQTDNSTARGLLARNLVVDGLLPELSLGSTASLDTEALTVSNKRVHELSLVEQGLRDGTVIEQADESDRPSYKDVQLRVLCSKRVATMAEGQTSVPKPTDAQPPTAATDVTDAPTNQLETTQPAAEKQRTASTAEELMARVAALEAENKSIREERDWMHDKTKRTYSAAFDAATEQFLRQLSVEDGPGRDKLVENLQKMARQPSLSGPEGNAVMEVVCAASRQNKLQVDRAEAALQELKRLKSSRGADAGANNDTSAAASAAAAAPPVTNFAERQQRHPPQVISRSKPKLSSDSHMANDAGRKMFAWLSDAKQGQGMEQVNYPGVVDRDFQSASVI